MLRWLYNFLDRRYGQRPSLQHIRPEEWEGLLAELADGYEKHAPVFRAIQLYLHRTERMAFKVPPFKTPEELALWKDEQYGLVREANALRYVLRFPIEGQKLRNKREKEKKAAEVAKAEEDILGAADPLD